VAAARLLDKPVFGQGAQVEGAVGGRLAEQLAGLRGGQRPGVGLADGLDQLHPERVGQRPHHLRITHLEIRAVLIGSHVSKRYTRNNCFDKSSRVRALADPRIAGSAGARVHATMTACGSPT